MDKCKTCGALLEENKPFCSACGAKVEQMPEFSYDKPSDPVDNTKKANDESTIPSVTAVPENIKRTKPKRKFAFAVVAVLLIAIVGGTIAYASSNSIKNTMKLMTLGSDAYLKEVFEEAVSKKITTLSDAYSKALENHDAIDAKGAYNFGFQYEVSPLMSSAFSGSEFDLKNIAADLSLIFDENKGSFDLGLSVNDTRLINLDVYFDLLGKVIYGKIPALSSSYLMFDMIELEELYSAYLTPAISNSSYNYSLSAKELEEICTTYSNLLIDMLTRDAKLDKDVSIKASDLTSSYNKFTTTLTEGMLYDFALTVLEALQNDKILADLLNEALKDQDSSLESLYKELKASEPDVNRNNILADYVAYVDNLGNIKGQELNFPETADNVSIGYLAIQDNSDNGLSVWVKENGVSIFSIERKCKDKNNITEGELTAVLAVYDDYYDDYTTYDMNIIFSDVKKDTNGTTTSGKYVLTSNLLPGSSMAMNLENTDEDLKLTLDLTYMGMNLGTIIITCNQGSDAKVASMDSGAKVYDIMKDESLMNDYLSEIDTEAFINDINSKLGVDIRPLLESVISESTY